MPTGYLFTNLLQFGRLLQALGIEVTAETQRVAARALERVDLGQREQVKGALSSVWVSRREQLPTVEESLHLFRRSYWGKAPVSPTLANCRLRFW
ncbi:MAG: hypothetical protein K0U98_15670 [Deltaproteobacteria bacterium]|nr:hypothetical protein [Deltaproteobacteria bacterium]